MKLIINLISNENVQAILSFVTLIIFLVVANRLFDFLFKDPINSKKKKEENKKETDSNELVQYLFSTKEGDITIYQSVLALIDSFISEALETYFKLEAPEDDHYINKEEADNINRYLLASVSKNMTPSVVHILSLVYDLKTDADLTKFLKLRIKLRMIDVIVNVNKPVE